MTPYESRQYRAQIDDSLMAEYVPMHLIFAGIPAPQDPRDNNERNETEESK